MVKYLIFYLGKMDELFSFIRSLKNANSKYLNDYYERLQLLIETIEIQGSKKYKDNYGYSIEIGNVYITACRTDYTYKNIEILINNKYMSINTDNIYYGILDYECIEDVIDFDYEEDDKYTYIHTEGLINVDNGNIDWLLDQKLIKSARKII